MVAVLTACATVILAAAAELLHVRRCRRLAGLAFGPQRRPAAWVYATPPIRIAALTALSWGLVTLLYNEPQVHSVDTTIAEGEFKHVVMVLDVSPSMRLRDAGPERDDSRMQRAAEVMQSFFDRVIIQQYKLSVVAFYTGAKPVVVDTTDVEVVRNILRDLPMHYAFKTGKTDVFAGLEEAVRVTQPWPPKSTTVILISDGDSVPATGMPKMPASVAHVLVVGVGDPLNGKFIDGHQSRQDTSALRQIALRLGGEYHDGNENHLSTSLLQQMTRTKDRSKFERLTRREYALIAIAVGAAAYALLPVLLHFLGTRWRPGVARTTTTGPATSTLRDIPRSHEPSSNRSTSVV